MFCPNCGANNAAEQKFCRACRLNLEKTSESLFEQLPSAQSANLMRREKAIERFGTFALSGLGVVGLAGLTVLLWNLVSRILVTGTNVFAMIMLLAFAIFAVLSLIFVILNESLKERKSRINSTASQNDSKEIIGAKNTGKLLEEKPFEPIPSVVEDSTELLLARNKTRKF